MYLRSKSKDKGGRVKPRSKRTTLQNGEEDADNEKDKERRTNIEPRVLQE